MSRDPRVDPRPGDVITKDGHNPRRVATLVHNVSGYTHALLWQRSRNHQLRRCTIDHWRSWARNATILHTAEVPDAD